MQTVKPANKFIFAKRLEADETTAAGIFLPTDTVKPPVAAEVINVGDHVKAFCSGETVLYKEYTSTEIQVNKEDYIMLHEDDILGKLIEVQEEGA